MHRVGAAQRVKGSTTEQGRKPEAHRRYFLQFRLAFQGIAARIDCTVPIVEAILDGKYPAHLTMKDLMEPFPMDWERQAEHFLGRGNSLT